MGVIDPAILHADNLDDSDRRLLARIADAGLSLHRISHQTRAVWLYGPGVDIKAAGLHLLSKTDLTPCTEWPIRKR